MAPLGNDTLNYAFTNKFILIIHEYIYHLTRAIWLRVAHAQKLIERETKFTPVAREHL